MTITRIALCTIQGIGLACVVALAHREMDNAAIIIGAAIVVLAWAEGYCNWGAPK